MRAMPDPDRTVTLVALNPSTDRAFSRNANAEFYVPPDEEQENFDLLSERESTPLQIAEDAKSDGDEYRHRLQLNFSQHQKNPSMGFVFGTKATDCDVVLGDLHERGISGLHFHLFFTVNKYGKSCLCLFDRSTNGTSVEYSGQCKDEIRTRFQWILNLTNTRRGCEVVIHVQGLEMLVRQQTRYATAEHHQDITGSPKQPDLFDVPLGLLGLQSRATGRAASSNDALYQRKPVFFTENFLGAGMSGQVYKVINVSTGEALAAKQYSKEEVEGLRRNQRFPSAALPESFLKEVQLLKGMRNVGSPLRLCMRITH